jgi:hypothetical protein
VFSSSTLVDSECSSFNNSSSSPVCNPSSCVGSGLYSNKFVRGTSLKVLPLRVYPISVLLSFSKFLNISFFILTHYCIFNMFFSCNSILIFNFKKCKNFPLGPLKKYLSAWIYDSTLSITNSVIYPPMVLSNQ